MDGFLNYLQEILQLFKSDGLVIFIGRVGNGELSMVAGDGDCRGGRIVSMLGQWRSLTKNDQPRFKGLEDRGIGEYVPGGHPRVKLRVKVTRGGVGLESERYGNDNEDKKNNTANPILPTPSPTAMCSCILRCHGTPFDPQIDSEKRKIGS